MAVSLSPPSAWRSETFSQTHLILSSPAHSELHVSFLKKHTQISVLPRGAGEASRRCLTWGGQRACFCLPSEPELLVGGDQLLLSIPDLGPGTFRVCDLLSGGKLAATSQRWSLGALGLPFGSG